MNTENEKSTFKIVCSRRRVITNVSKILGPFELHLEYDGSIVTSAMLNELELSESDAWNEAEKNYREIELQSSPIPVLAKDGKLDAKVMRNVRARGNEPAAFLGYEHWRNYCLGLLHCEEIKFLITNDNKVFALNASTDAWIPGAEEILIKKKDGVENV